ncbi:hypothetical protein KQI41_01085 [Tissierella pigra]|uniref:hypothetical protein n=1 Tax=Tissierella pigra TaxID=2607614 RepID=UPI001C122FFD|nr:hypothetical protein [Tissierella pigra]MBU5424989.1 hypothetical protein [Tissierella pigra]
MNKKELLKKLELFQDDEDIVILCKDNNDNDYFTSLEKITFVKNLNDGYEIVLIPHTVTNENSRRTEKEIKEIIDEKLLLLEHYIKADNFDMAKTISTQLVILHWVIGLDGYHYYQPYDDVLL